MAVVYKMRKEDIIMTYKGLLELIKAEMLKEPNVHQVIFPDIYAMNNLPDLQYSLGAITPNTFTRVDNLMQYSLNCYYIDR